MVLGLQVYCGSLWQAVGLGAGFASYNSHYSCLVAAGGLRERCGLRNPTVLCCPLVVGIEEP